MESLTAQVDALFAYLDKPDAPGCVLGIVQDGNLVYARGYGMANLDYGIPITTDSRFLVASMSKQFTAACIALLAQRSQLSLDDDVREYVPEIPPYDQPITIRHLLHHTSGLRSYTTLMDMAGWREEDYHDNQDAVQLLSRQKALDFRPGTEHVYCNSGYILLAEIVERTSGSSLREFAQENIFGPLGMVDTQFYDDCTRVVRNRVTSYGPQPGGSFRRYLKNNDALGPTGLLTTVQDLYLWDQNFYHHQVGGPELIAQMETRGVLSSGEEIHYAFGLAHGAYRGLEMLWHGGLVLGFRSQMIRFPEQLFTVICLANLAGTGVTRLIQRVADIYLSDLFDQKQAAFIELPPQRLREVLGVYLDETTGFNVELLMPDSTLLAKVFGSPIPVAPIRATADTIVLRELGGPLALEIEMRRRPPARSWRLHMQISFHRPPTLPALVVDEPETGQMAEYAGRYASEELQTTYEIMTRDGVLYAVVGNGPPSPLKPGRGVLFRLAGGILCFTRNEAGQVVGFTRTGPMARNLYFQRMSS